MPLLLWSPSLSVGVAEIDAQHQRIVQYINDLNDFSGIGKDIGFLQTLLHELTLYTREHFTLEEKYFSLYNYPDAEDHVKEHQAFIEKIQDFSRELQEGRIDLLLPLAKFLSDWLITHILETDMAYATFFNEKGLR